MTVMERELLVARRMSAKVVGKQSPLVGVKCALCQRSAKPDDEVLCRRNGLDEAPAYEHYLVIHLDCLAPFSNRAAERIIEEGRRRFSEVEQEWLKALS